jgi:asparagine synthetase A
MKQCILFMLQSNYHFTYLCGKCYIMVYTIRIQDKSKKAKGIIKMLKALRNDYDFIEISEEYDNQNDIEIMKELESRYNSFLKDTNGKEWNVLMNELSK